MGDVHDIVEEARKRADDDEKARNLLLGSDYADEAMARRFTEKHANELAYVEAWRRWLVWEGPRWRLDETLAVFDRFRTNARENAEVLRRQSGGERHAAKILSAQSIYAAEKLARADRRHAMTPKDFDSDPWALNTPDGTIDLRTGELRPHRREDYITKSTRIAPGGECPRFEAFLDRVFDGDAGMVAYVRRIFGYALTGIIREETLFFFLGVGANGKSVLLKVMRSVAADYCVVAPADAFVASSLQKHSTDLAMLKGARLAMTTEIERGQQWAEARLKAMTSGDPITARFMRQNNFTFEPTHKLIVAGNHAPAIGDVGQAFRRRLQLVPFDVVIPEDERDLSLSEKLLEEARGILAWAIEGCVDWRRNGLCPPPKVARASKEYLDREDVLGRFLEERCDASTPNDMIELQALFNAWSKWCEANDEFAGTKKSFSRSIVDRGFKQGQHPKNRRAIFFGLTLRDGDTAKETKGSFN